MKKKLQYSKLTRITLSLIILTLSSVVQANENIPIDLKQLLLQGQFKQAVKQLEKLSTQNNVQAKYQLAILLLDGRGIKKNLPRAESLLQECSTTLPEASFLLGSLYFKGNLLEKNNNLAKQYLIITANTGNMRAKNMLEKIDARIKNNSRAKPQTQRLFELAITSGNLSLVIKQYLNGANLNYPNSEGNPPIITAISLGRKNISHWLIKQKIDFNKQDDNGNNSFHIAAKYGQIENIVLLASHFGNIDTTNKTGQSPLILAIKNKHLSTAQWLINQGAKLTLRDSFGKSANDYNIIAKLALVNPQQVNSNSLKKTLIARKQRAHQMGSLLAQSKKTTSPYFQWPLLAIAIAQDQLILSNQLLNSGESPWKETQQYDTAVSLALNKGHIKILNRMLNSFPIEQQNNPQTIEKLFFTGIKKDNISIVKSSLKKANQLGIKDLIQKGLMNAIRNKNVKSVTLFMKINNKKLENQLLGLSISKNNIKIAKLLIEKGLDVNWQDKTGKTPLIRASQKGNIEAITLLLKRKAIVEIADKQGVTALMWATKQNCLPCVQLLILKGADPEYSSIIGNTAIMFAAQRSNNILKALLTKESDLSVRNQQSLTALMLAVNNNCIECVKTLLALGANPGRRNAKGQDSFDLASNKASILSILNAN